MSIEDFSLGDKEDFTKPVGVDLSNVNLSDFNLGDIASGFSGDIGNLGITPDFLEQLNANPDLLRAFQAEFPDDFNAIKDIINVGNLETDDAVVTDRNQIVSTSGDVQESMDSPNRGGATDVTKTTDKTKDKKGILGTDITAGDAAKYAAMLAIAKMAYDDAQRAREAAKGWSPKSSPTVTARRSGKTDGVTYRRAATGGGIGSLDMARGGRALPPRYLDGHSDGMADKVSANIDGRRPAALSDGEFVIPADVVSHLGNGNSNAGAKRLYEMMDRIRAARTGNPKQGKQINPDKFMPR